MTTELILLAELSSFSEKGFELLQNYKNFDRIDSEIVSEIKPRELFAQMAGKQSSLNPRTLINVALVYIDSRFPNVFNKIILST